MAPSIIYALFQKQDELLQHYIIDKILLARSR